jgi:uncharacterized protein
MPQDNVEIVRRAYEAWNRGDLEAWYAIFTPDAVVEAPSHSPTAGTYRGIDQVRRYLDTWRQSFEWHRFEPDRFIPVGTSVVATGLQHGVGKRSGAEVREPEAHVWEMHGGHATRMCIYADATEALEAAGMREQPAREVE